jgi:hypothetical protein
MKYFTPELLERIGSLDDGIADVAHDAWERMLVRSQRRWQKIKAAFPEAVQRFEAERVCLHDAQVLSMGRPGDTFVMVLKMEPPSANRALGPTARGTSRFLRPAFGYPARIRPVRK